MNTESHASFNGITKEVSDTTVTYGSLYEEDGGVRHTFDRTKIEQLSRNIAAVGLLQPIVVVAEGKKYRIVNGRRRYRAIGLLKWRAVDVRIVTEDAAKRLSRAREISENTNREQVPPYELALEAHKMVTPQKDSNGEAIPPQFTREEVALYFGCTVKYLNNLVRCVEKCSPVVLQAWKKDPENITTNLIAAWAVMDHKDQESAIEEFIGGTKADKKRIKKATKKAGHGKKDIAKMAEKWAEKKGAFAEGVTAALMYAMGERASIRE